MEYGKRSVSTSTLLTCPACQFCHYFGSVCMRVTHLRLKPLSSSSYIISPLRSSGINVKRRAFHISLVCKKYPQLVINFSLITNTSSGKYQAPFPIYPIYLYLQCSVLVLLLVTAMNIRWNLWNARCSWNFERCNRS